jgi:hypothetical protein
VNRWGKRTVLLHSESREEERGENQLKKWGKRTILLHSEEERGENQLKKAGKTHHTAPF